MRFLTYNELKTKKGIDYSRAQLYRLESADPPQFPQRVHLSSTRVVWAEEEIDEWQQAKLAERLTAPKPTASEGSGAWQRKRERERRESAEA